MKEPRNNISNEELIKATKNSDFIGIMNKVGTKFSRQMSKDDLDSIKLVSLWKALSHYNPENNIKLTSYLYIIVNRDCLSFLKSSGNKMSCRGLVEENEVKDYRHPDNNYEIMDFLSVLSEENKNIIVKSCIENLPLREIAEKSGTYTEAIRRKKKKALLKLKNSLKN